MAYTPTEWKAGDTVTSSGLNKIENELKKLSGASGLVIVGNNYTDLSFNEIYNMAINGTMVMFNIVEEGRYLTLKEISEASISVYFGDNMVATASNTDSPMKVRAIV